MDFLIAEFNPNSMKVSLCTVIIVITLQHQFALQELSFTFDVLYPEGLNCVIMNMFKISRKEVCVDNIS